MFSREWPISTDRNWIRCLFAFLLSLVPITLLASPVPPDKLKDLQGQFDREPHAPFKVKLLQKLGEAQFAAATRAQGEGNYIEIGLTLEKYRDNVRATFELLKKQEPNADKHSEGYRHLELQTRRGIREVEDILIIVPAEVRPPLEIVRDDLIKMDDELIGILFPRRTKEIEKVPPPPGVNP